MSDCKWMYTPQVLPYAYDGSLTYVEQLYKLCQEIQDVKTSIAGIEQGIIDQVNAMFAAQDAKVDKKLADMQKQLDATLDEIYALIDSIEAKVDVKIAENQAWVEQQVADMRAYVSGQIMTIRKYVDELNSQTISYIDSEIQKVIDMIPEITSTQVRPPWGLLPVPIQRYVDEADNHYRLHGISMKEYDRASIPFNEYAAQRYSFWFYNNRVWLKYNTWNQLQGDYTSTQKYLDDLLALHTELGITYQLYNFIGKTYTEYNDLHIPFKEYTLRAKYWLGASIYKGITFAEYAAKALSFTAYNALNINYATYNNNAGNVLAA